MAFKPAPAPLKETFWLDNRINPEWEKWFANVINPAIEVVRDVEVLATIIESLPVPVFQAGISDIEKLAYSQPADTQYLLKKIEALEALTLNAPLVILPQDLQEGASPIFKEAVDRYTSNQTLTAKNRHVFGDTDGGGFTIQLPPGIVKTLYRIVNTGSSEKMLRILPDGLELLLGENKFFDLFDKESLWIVYEATEGWF